MTRVLPVRSASDWTKSAVPKGQEAIAAEWADKAQALLSASSSTLPMPWHGSAMQRRPVRLCRGPLSLLKVQIADRVKVIEDLQHRVQVQREAAVLLAQRIEVLSTKSWRDAQAALELLRADVARWQEQAQGLTSDASWVSVEARFPNNWKAPRPSCWWCGRRFSPLWRRPLRLLKTSMPSAPVPVWADELRVARGLPSEAAAAAAKSARPAKPKVDPEVRDKAVQAVREALATLEKKRLKATAKPVQARPLRCAQCSRQREAHRCCFGAASPFRFGLQVNWRAGSAGALIRCAGTWSPKPKGCSIALKARP